MAPLDGVRALAVVAVVAYHAGLPWARGGFLGVDVFFVLSGFLITSLLLVDHDVCGRVRLVRFWRRRARRLLPALGIVLVAVAAAVPLLAPDQGWRLRGDLLAALGYVGNWRLVFQHQSYFQAMGRPPLLQHLWSLAVEEQFYLVWPVVAAVALRVGITRRGLGRLALVGAAVSAALMAALYRPTADPSRVYYGTDTRVAALLVGAALACLWPRRRALSVSRLRSAATRTVLDVVGLAALAALAACVVGLHEFRPGLYRGGFLGVALVAGALVAVGAAERRTLVGTVLGSAPLVWLGRRSYAVYLWFWPVFMLTRPHADVPLDGLPLLGLRVVVTLGLASASYRFVELPVRNGAVGRSWRTLRARPGRASVGRAAAWGLAMAVSLAVVGAGVVVKRRAEPPPGFAVTASAAVAGPLTVTRAPDGPDPASMTGPATTVPQPPTVAAPEAAAATAVAPAPVPAPVPAVKVTGIGESVLMEVQSELAETIGDFTLDAAVGRQMGATVAAVHRLRDSGSLGEIVLVQVGNNGVITSGEFDELMDMLSAASRVVVVNVKVPRPWEGPNNDVLSAGVGRWRNAVLLDWHRLGSDHPDWFLADGVHLKSDGAHLFAQFLLSGLTAPPATAGGWGSGRRSVG